jgi:hypothetical protein
VWELENGKEVAVLEHADAVSTASFSPDDQLIVTWSWDNIVRLWCVKTGRTTAQFDGYDDYVTRASFSPNGKRVVLALQPSVRHRTHVLNIEANAEVALPEAVPDEGENITVSISPDSRFIALVSADDALRIWDVERDREVGSLKGRHRLFERSFSPDGRRIVTTSPEPAIWDIHSGRNLAVLKGQRGERSLGFSPDGRRIAMTADRDAIQIWDVESGAEMERLEGHDSYVFSAAFSPDGKRVVTSSDDQTARVWDVTRSATLVVGEKAQILTGAVSHGVGCRTASESEDLLMQDAPEDLYGEANRQLLDLQKYPPEEIARRQQVLRHTIADLRAPLHPNCYLSPIQFAEKFGLAHANASQPMEKATAAQPENRECSRHWNQCRSAQQVFLRNQFAPRCRGAIWERRCQGGPISSRLMGALVCIDVGRGSSCSRGISGAEQHLSVILPCCGAAILQRCAILSAENGPERPTFAVQRFRPQSGALPNSQCLRGGRRLSAGPTNSMLSLLIL